MVVFPGESCWHTFFCFGIKGRPLINFHFSLLAAISKRGSRTDDDDDDEGIMFQLCTDAKS